MISCSKISPLCVTKSSIRGEGKTLTMSPSKEKQYSGMYSRSEKQLLLINYRGKSRNNKDKYQKLQGSRKVKDSISTNGKGLVPAPAQSLSNSDRAYLITLPCSQFKSGSPLCMRSSLNSFPFQCQSTCPVSSPLACSLSAATRPSHLLFFSPYCT